MGKYTPTKVEVHPVTGLKMQIHQSKPIEISLSISIFIVSLAVLTLSSAAVIKVIPWELILK